MISAAVISDHRLSAAAERVRFAAVAAATSTALAVRRGLQDRMKSAFDRPTPFTLDALAVQPATMDRPVSRIFIKDGGRYLHPQIQGGPRRDKRAETMLRQAGMLPAGMQAVPGKAAKLDAYGNMDRSQLVAMLSALRAFNVAGFTANRRADGKSRGVYRRWEFFVMRRGDRRMGKALPPGVYFRDNRNGKDRRGASASPLLVFVKGPRYQPRFDFHGLAAEMSSVEYPRQFQAALAKWGDR